MSKENISTPKKLLFTAILVVVLLLVAEGVAWLGLRVLDKNYNIKYQPNLTLELSQPHQKSLRMFIDNELGLTGYSESLGWTNKPNVATPDGIHISNSKGLRGKAEFQNAKPLAKKRISTFGDSFTYGMEVSGQQTWQQHLESLSAEYQTLNFGVGAHGPDQAFIRYLNEGRQFENDYVFIGYMSENIGRILNVYRPFYMPTTGIPVTKPRFKIAGKQLRKIENPNQSLTAYEDLLNQPAAAMRRYGKEDFYFQRGYAAGIFDWSSAVRLAKMAQATFLRQPVYDKTGVYNRDGEGFKLLKKILEEFYLQVQADGAEPIILISPQFIDVARRHEGRPVKYQPLLEWLDEQNYQYIDLMGAVVEFDKDNVIYDFFSRSKGHYSSLGNQAVAQAVHQHLLQSKKLPPRAEESIRD